jgi:hypothetical protein
MSIQVQEDKNAGVVTLVCDGEWVVIAGKLMGRGALPASSSQQAEPVDSGSRPPPINPAPPPPPPILSVAGVGPKGLDLKLHKALGPKFEDLVNAAEFKQFAGALNDDFVLMISPAGAAERIKMPARVATKMGDLPVLHRYVEIE